MKDFKIALSQLQGSLYLPADFYLLRAPVLPSTYFFLLAGERKHLTDDELKDRFANLDDMRTNHEEMLRFLTSQPVIEQALAVASFSILEGLATLRGKASESHARPTFSSLLRYLIRMSTRPTPFGLFAGVAIGTFADVTTASLALPVQRQIRARPDMGWLLSLVQKIEQVPELVAQLRVTLNQRIYEVQDKGFLPYADIYGQSDNRFISFEITPIVKYVLNQARQPIIYTDLLQALQEVFPDESAENLHRCLWQLWEDHVLISTLHSPLTSSSPVNYVREQLRHLKGADDFGAKLQVVLEDILAIDTNGTQGSVEDIRTLVAHQRQLVSTTMRDDHPPLSVDTALHILSPKIHKSVGEAAALAAEMLLRLTPSQHGPQHLCEYRLAFEEKFGDNAEVPLRALLSPELGLDAPRGYRRPARTYPLRPSLPPQTKKRDAFLCALVAEAVNEQSLEIELTDAHLQKLERWNVSREHAPLSLEIHLQIHAASRSALDQGDWKAVVSPSYGASAGGSSIARFIDLEGPENRHMLQQFIQREEALYPSAIFAELSYQPWYGRAANIALRPLLRSYEICVGTSPTLPPDRVIMLDDIVVGVRNERFYLRSLRLKKQIIVSQGHMLTSEVAPNLCRFLAETSQDGYPLLFPFDWGVAARMPFLPRIRQGRVVLSLAQWNIRLETPLAADAKLENLPWFLRLQQWRKQWRVPRYVYLSVDDNRLLLDLEHPLFAEELRIELTKIGDDECISLQEVLPDFDHTWLQDEQGASYFSEIVVPLLRNNIAETTNSKIADTTLFQFPRLVTPSERYALPGEDWVYIKLFVSFRLQDTLIAGPLRQIVQQLQEQEIIDRWFYIRYSDPEPHLRLRLHASASEKAQQLLGKILHWSQQLVEQQGILHTFSLDTYVREVERYGGPWAIDALERVFTANSVALSNLIAIQQTPSLSVDPLAIAVFSLDQFLLYWGFDGAQRLTWMQWRTRYYGKYEAKKDFHQRQRTFCDLLTASPYTPNNEIVVLREQLNSALSVQEPIVRNVSTLLSHLTQKQQLWCSKDDILSNILHMHINRLLGAGSGQERQIYAVWKYTLESIHRRMQNERL